MFGLGPPELIIILVIALLIMGPSRLPKAGRAIGEGIKEFKDAATSDGEDDEDLTGQLESDLNDLSQD